MNKHSGERFYCARCGWYSLNSIDGIVGFDKFGYNIRTGDLVVVPYMESQASAPDLIIGVVMYNKVIYLDESRTLRWVWLTSRETAKKCKVIKVITKDENNLVYTNYKNSVIVARTSRTK